MKKSRKSSKKFFGQKESKIFFGKKRTGEEKAWSTSYLSTSKPTKSRITRMALRKPFSLQTDDIPGAHRNIPKQIPKFTKNLKHFEGTDGIEGSKPRNFKQTYPLNKRSTINKVSDIEGAMPINKYKFFTRGTNPLNPNYGKMTNQKINYPPVENQRFVRDTLNFYNNL